MYFYCYFWPLNTIAEIKTLSEIPFIIFTILIIFFVTHQRFPLVSLGYLWSYFRLLLNTQGTKSFEYFQFRLVIYTFEEFHLFNIISLSCDKGSTQYQFRNYGIISILYFILPSRLPLQRTSPFLRGMAPTLSWASLFSTKLFLDN